VTDAHVVLGTLDPAQPLAGGVHLDSAAAHGAVGRLARQLGMSDADCARGILRVANTEMIRALRVMTVERGLDPRGFALLAFGGAGPLHAAAIADELEIRRILVPRASGVLSALGLAAADRRVTRQRSVFLSADEAADPDLGAVRDELLEEALTTLGTPAPNREVAYDVRYHGQSHELTVRGPELIGANDIAAAFAADHERRYGWREAQTPVEIVTVRLTAIVPGPELDLRSAGGPGERVTGPDVLHLPETTVAVPEGWAGAVDDTGTLVLERRA